jgi:hypothetical protein
MQTIVYRDYFEDATEVIRAVNQRMTDNTKAKEKKTNNDLQIIAQKIKDPATRTPL